MSASDCELVFVQEDVKCFSEEQQYLFILFIQVTLTV